MAETPVPGYGWKIYQNTGTYASPVWALITGTRDINVPMTADELDDSSRDSRYKKFLSGMIDLGVTFQMRYHLENADHTDLLNKFFAQTVFEIAVVNGDISVSGTEGIRAFVQLFSNSISLPLGDNSNVDFSAKPAFVDEGSGEIDPEWYTVPA
jgi:predicted secreted protein